MSDISISRMMRLRGWLPAGTRGYQHPARLNEFVSVRSNGGWVHQRATSPRPRAPMLPLKHGRDLASLKIHLGSL